VFPEEIQYGGFWRRFAALWVDVLCLLPVTLLVLWGDQHYRLFIAYYFIPGQLFGLFYSVYLVHRFGGTPGKLALGLRIRRNADLSPVGYREAFLRYLPDLTMGILTSVGMIFAHSAIADSDYLALGFSDRTRRLTELAPSWYNPLQVLLQIWMWSEFFVLLTNRKRRAIHDFIAGTVVVVAPPPPCLTDEA
jgi:uncharacterized RDD family membrane protein YckC